MTAPPPPVEIERRPIAFYDTECFPNYWLLTFRTRDGHTYKFSLRAGQKLSSEDISRIILIFNSYCAVSFNGNYYDVPMICAALSGYTCEQLKWLNDRIILEKAKPWELGLPEWKPSDHIDVMEVVPGAGSQKQYAGRIHCKTMRDLPYSPNHYLTEPEIAEVDSYNGNDLTVLENLFDALHAQLFQRELLGKRYGIDLRSKSDAQLAEAVLKLRCEQATGRRIFKPEINWNLKFRYKAPSFISYQSPQLQKALQLVCESIFQIGAKGSVEMPPQLEGLLITIGNSTYKIGIGGLHSREETVVHKSDENYVLRDNDVAAYYPSLILNSGEWPPALGQAFLQEYEVIKNERIAAKQLQAKLKKEGKAFTDKEVEVKRVINDGTEIKYVIEKTKAMTPEYENALVGNEGGKIMINGTFGKTGSPYSVLFAPEMLIQTTITGQLSLLMLIEWHEHYNIPVVSANTDGIVIKCPRNLVSTSEALITEWQKRTGLEMETVEYRASYSRDINNYFAIKTDGEVKRKGEYSKAGLVEKKNPDVEICADAVADFLANGTPLEYTIGACRDIRKFVTIQKVNGGGVKMWGEGPRKGIRVTDMISTLQANGWIKEGRKWFRGVDGITDATTAYGLCFAPQRAEYLGKVVRWYYSTQAPGPIIYASNGKTVSLSYGARPCMTLPDQFPEDIDYGWYIAKAEGMLKDVGYYNL